MILNADARRIPLASSSVQCVVTSPPYWNLRDYGVPDAMGMESSFALYQEQLMAVFDEVRRVLRDDGTLWLNMGDSYGSGGSGGTGAASSKQRTNEGSYHRGRTLPTAPKQLLGQPWRIAFALQERGWYLRSDIIWSKPNPMPESVTDRPTKSHEYMFLLTKSSRYFYDAEAVKEAAIHEGRVVVYDGSQKNCEAARDPLMRTRIAGTRVVSGRNKRDVWTIPTSPFGEAHFATFPPDLVIPCIKAGSAEGDLVLDPFAGSGTVGVVARKLVRRFVGLELNPAYCDMATRRIDRECPANLFDEVRP